MMKKSHYLALVGVLFSLVLVIQPSKAYFDDNSWYEYWHQYKWYFPPHPQNISSTITVYSEDYHFWARAALVVSVCQYIPYSTLYDAVILELSLYFESFRDPSYGYRCPAAKSVTFFIHKDTSGSNLQDQTIDIEKTTTTPGFHQGYGLVQTLSTESTAKQRYYYGIDALATAAGLFLEPIGVAEALINLGAAFQPQGVDYRDATHTDTWASSYWSNPGFDFGDQNPVRQYAYNTWRWFQAVNVKPSTFYGIKVSARVVPLNPLPPFDTPPVYLWIYGSGGGGCPYVSVWNGTHHVLDNNLIPGAERSNGTDVTDYYMLQQPLIRNDGKYSLLIWDLDKHSFLDHAELLAVDHESDVNVAVSPYGEILTYKNPAALIAATDQNGQDLTNVLSSVDGDYFEGYAGDHVLLDFGSLDVSKGAKLIFRADDGCELVPCKESIHVQVSKAGGEWVNAASFIPRIYWSTDAIDMSNYLPDINGDVKVRLYFTAHHKIDYVGLDTSKQGEFETRYASLAEANHSRLGEVKEILVSSDDQRVELLPSESITLGFTLPQNTEEKRDFIIVLEGHYFIIS